jgi:hypothetical protein
MKSHNLSCIQRLMILAALFLFAFSGRADPISIPERSITPQITILIAFSIFLEAICILLLLRRSQKPRFFILWLVGMHVVTYPAFLGLLRLLQDMRPSYAAGIGEGLVVLVEGTLIYLICRFIPSASSDGPKPSILKCLFASLVGNAVSAAAFPVLMFILFPTPS